MKTRTTRQGFTLVELLVVIAIIGILVSLLLPALGQVREAANSSNCKANLKNVGLAAKAYESRMNTFPAALRMAKKQDLPTGNYGASSGGVASVGGSAVTAPFSFFTHLLPDLDSAYINNQLDYTTGAFATSAGDAQKQDATGANTTNAAVMGSPIPILRCPSSSNNGLSDAAEYANITDANNNPVEVALTSYKPVSATSLAVLSGANSDARVYVGPTAANNNVSSGMGILSPYETTRPQATSLALLLAETDEADYAAWGDGATICLFGMDTNGDVDINSDPSKQTSSTDDDGNTTSADTPWADAGFNGSQGAIRRGVGSSHPGTINVVMGDGSARTFSEEIDDLAWTAFITNAAQDNAAASTYIAGGNN